MATWPSGHKVWRVREDQLHKLPNWSGEKDPRSKRDSGIKIITEDGVVWANSLLYAPYAGEFLVSKWRPI